MSSSVTTKTSRQPFMCSSLSKCLQNVLIVISILSFISCSGRKNPSLDGSSKDPILAISDEEVFIDCRVDNIANYTLVWKFLPPTAKVDDPGEIIAAGMVRVTSDIRFDVLHEEDSSVWILRIRRAKASDSGLYSCELNTDPKKRISRIVAVADEDDLPPISSPPGHAASGGSSRILSILEVEHNYTDCCIKESVPKACHHFCQFRGLITDVEPQGSSVHSCINHLSSITKCLADGRDHMPCCRRQNIPETCRPVCVGNFSLTTVLDHFTCMHYTAPVLACIAEGVQILPPQVSRLTVEPVSSTAVNVSWSLPRRASDASLIETIQINVTQLHSFDGIGVRLSPKKDSNEESDMSAPTVREVSTASSSSSTLDPPDLYGLQMRYTVAGNESFFIVPDLKAYTMYEIQVKSLNRAGSSLPMDPIRTLTLTSDPKSKGNREETDDDESGSSTTSRDKESETPTSSSSSPKKEDKETSPKKKVEGGSSSSGEKEETGDSHVKKPGTGRKEGEKEGDERAGEGEEESSSATTSSTDKKKKHKNGKGNELPDMKQCCRSKGVMIDRCLDVLCDPVRSDEATLTDLMICAPFANVTFSCLADGVDHSSCCQSRGVTSNCLEFCSGKVKKLDFRHFVCLDQLTTFSSCVLDHHKVLPGPATSFMVVNVHHDWAIIKWNPPKILPETVTKYLIHYREVNRDDPSGGRYNVTEAKASPFLLDKLTPGGRYEVYVKAGNSYGTSQGSSRVVFSTPPLYSNEEVELMSTSNSYNETQCCSRAGLNKDCLPLCSYRVKVTDVLQRASLCAQTLPTLVRCGAGGRNHIPCCRRRGVSDGCLNICAGLVESSPYVVAARCSDDLGKILQCMEEGSGLLPGMPVDFHASLVTKDTMHLEWQPAIEDVNVTSISFQVRYGKADSDIPLHPLAHDSSVNTTEPNALITGLEPGTRYSLYVVASNSYGISLPSLVLIVNTSSGSAGDSKMVQSNIGPPHSIQILHQSTDTITFKWMPPLYVPPDSSIKYIVHYKAVNGTAAEKSAADKSDWIMIETSFNTMFLMNLTYDTEYAITIQAVNDRDRNIQSSLSEVALVWTDPAIPASVNLPVVIPAGPIIEGNNVTFMCIGVGTPTPTLSLLLNGQVVLKEERRHIALTVVGVKRNLTSVSCYATNGFSPSKESTQAAQSSLEIRVRFKPKISTSSTNIHVVKNSPTRLQCEFSGNPQPHVLWFKDTSDGKQVQMSPSSRVSFVTVTHSDMTTSWINSLVFKNVNESDAGDYHCMAVNDLGQDAGSLELFVDISKNYSSNARECCQSLGVAPDCLAVCSFDVDIDSALGIASCYPDIDKLMTCAADGSDHRSCCRRRGVPADCIRWCAGLKVTKASLCSLSSAHDIVNCFQEGKALLPGPPKEVHVKHFVEKDRVRVEWKPPDRNPELVQYYRVFWRPVGSRDLNRNQTDGTQPYFDITGLDPSKMYEFVVKSGNHYGLSIFTDPLVISPSSLKSASSLGFGNQLLKVLTTVSVIAFIVILGSGIVLYVFRRYIPQINSMRLMSNHGLTPSSSPSTPSSSRGVSFENPSYMKDTNGIPSVQFKAGEENLHELGLHEVNANYDPSPKITLISP